MTTVLLSAVLLARLSGPAAAPAKTLPAGGLSPTMAATLALAIYAAQTRRDKR